MQERVIQWTGLDDRGMVSTPVREWRGRSYADFRRWSEERKKEYGVESFVTHEFRPT